jgi:PKD repeat protein
MANEIFPNSSRSPASVGLGQPVTLTWSASATLGIAYREGSVVKPNGVVVPLARVWYPDGPLGPQAFTDTAEAGTYRWRSRYADMSIIDGAGDGVTAQYYNDTVLSALVFTRTDPAISFDFPAATPPSPGIVSDHYSMRWTGTIVPRYSEVYTFSTRSDDGVRVWINGIKIIDNWTDHPETIDVGVPSMFLNANTPVSVKVEFFNNFGPGVIHLRWESNSQNLETIPNSRYRNTGTGTLTYGTGYKDNADLLFTVAGLSQSTVSISPVNSTVPVGTTLTFTASGGSGGGLFNWGGQASGVGTTKQVTFNTIGSYQVTVYKASDGTYGQSNVATATITVGKANQAALVATPPSQSAPVGNVVTLTASGGSGTGQYQWGGAVSLTTSQNFIQFQIPVSGLSQITCKKLADSQFNESNTVTFSITGTKLAQATVTISPTSMNVEPGTQIVFTAGGGTGSGLYQWGGEGGTTTGPTKTVTFNTVGTRSVTVFRQQDAQYNQSNTATATIIVQVHTISPASTRSPATRPAGQPFTLTWGATATLGIAYREGSILQPGGGTILLARVNSFEPGMMGPQSFLPTAGKGVYTWTARYADQSINTGPPFTNGTGTAEQQLSFTVTGLSQSTVVITPSSGTVAIGGTISFTASGGSGTGDYQWGSEGSGTGATKLVTFNTAGVRTVTVKKLGDSTFDDSNTATATITVTKLVQSTVTVTPSQIDVEPGTQVLFTANGGDSSGDYQWGGDATGTGSSKLVTFNVGGARTVTVFKPEDATYAASNVATANVNVAVHIITPLSTATPNPAPYGALLSLKWNATATVGIYYREGSVTKPDGTIVPLARVFNNEAGMLGPQSFSDTAQRGTYAWLSRYADNSILSPPETYGVGYRDQTLNIVVNGLAQQQLSISPGPSINVFVGSTVVFTALGGAGAGTGNYTWYVFHHITGITTTHETTIPEFTYADIPLGQKTIRVERAGDFVYEPAAMSTPVQVTVARRAQTTLAIAPAAISVEVGSQVNFNAIGGNGTGQYQWSGGGSIVSSKVYTFSVVGTFNVTVSKLADGQYLQSNTASATVVVTNKLPPQLSLSATPPDGPAPLDTVISWSVVDAISAEISGPGLSSTAFSGSQQINDLLTGVKIYTLTATNAGGTSTASVQVTVDLQPVETTGFTVHFTDQSVLRADSWLWDFGDGSSTSTVRNPIHTYAELGVYLVTLTVTCDGKTDTKQKLISIGCNPNDPLPFTPDWNTLVNEETFPPFDDPRYVDTDFTSPLGPSAVRQSGPSNPNWTMCTNVDYCDGPAQLGIPQETRWSSRWTVKLINSQVTFGLVGLPLFSAPGDMIPPFTNLSNASYITMAFDSTANPFFAYQSGNNLSRVHFRVNGTPLSLLFNGESPRLFSETIINPISELCDVVLFYIRNGSFYVRLQRDNFNVEYFLAEPTFYGEELAVITKVDANKVGQRIYVYAKTIGGKRLLFRSGLYPAFPSEDPIHVDVDPETGNSAITLSAVAYGYIDTVDFTNAQITLSVVDHSPGYEKANFDFTIGNGSYARDPQHNFASHFLTLQSGTSALGSDRSVNSVSFVEGTSSSTAGFGTNAVTLLSGTSARWEDNGTNAVTLLEGRSESGEDLGQTVITLLNGTEARRDERINHNISLATVIHLAGTESATSRITLERVFHLNGTFTGVQRESLELIRYLPGTHKAVHLESLRSVSHLFGTHRSVSHISVVSIVHRPWFDGGKVAVTLSSGRNVKADNGVGITASTLFSVEHAFGLLTFDNTDHDHFDSTRFTWDLNVSGLDPDVA